MKLRVWGSPPRAVRQAIDLLELVVDEVDSDIIINITVQEKKK